MTSAERIAARFRIAEVIGNPKDFLVEFERIVDSAAQRVPPGTASRAAELDAKMRQIVNTTGRFRSDDLPGYKEMTSLAWDARMQIGTTAIKLRLPGHKLFLSILQTLVLPPALRKKVEVASRVYMKDGMPKRKRYLRDFDVFADYEKMVAAISLHLQTAKDAIATGKPHSEEGDAATRTKVGPFTLVNTGGFNPKIMANIVEIVEKATKHIQASGLAKVCYGDIQVTNTITNSSTAAFYLISSDELFIRANAKPHWDTIHTVMHELGHRFQAKFLRSRKNAVLDLFRMLSGQEQVRRKQLYEEKPKKGDTLLDKGVLYEVLGTDWNPRKGVIVVLRQVDNPASTASISLEGWHSKKTQTKEQAGLTGVRNFEADPNFKGFVSEYAKTDPDENFAEMFSFYCAGRLPVLQSAAFEELVFGHGDLTAAVRVASRFISAELPTYVGSMGRHKEFYEVWAQSLDKKMDGLDLSDPEDRSSFRGMVEAGFRNLRADGLKDLIENLGVKAKGSSKLDLSRTIADAYIDGKRIQP